MFLKSLDIQGFKSFADKTRLEFHQGVTGIVGPNGCGKSNIVDAIRWVLGETSAKALRGGEMADVIFNGTDKRHPLGLAEVTLTLSGCAGFLETEFDEVSLGRRVYRDGKGEYLLNKQPCRLKDIHNLLMDTGIGRSSYSIMEQGKIDLLLSSKPEDRRTVFEEAAGITKYKTQKKEALRKLDYTEANLVRLRDIVEEVERQMRSLQRQAGKARRYQTLFSDVKILDLHLGHKQWRELRAEHGELEVSTGALRRQLSEIETTIEDRQNEVIEARRRRQEIEDRLSQLKNDIVTHQNEIQSATNRIEFNVERAHELSVHIQTNEAEISSAAEKLGQQQEDLTKADDAVGAVDRGIADFLARQEEHRAAVEAAAAERRELTGHWERQQKERSNLESRSAALEARIESHSRQLQSDRLRVLQLNDEASRIQKDEQGRNRDADELRERIREHQRIIERYEEELSRSEDDYHQARRQLEEVIGGLGDLHRIFSEKSSRLEVLKQLVAEGEGFGKGAQAVLRGLDEPDLYKQAVRGSLAGFIEVEDPFVSAIEAALGQRLQAILVGDILMVEGMIESLKKGRLGQATLISEDFVPPPADRQMLTVPAGAAGWALDSIECDDRVRSLIDRLLDNVLIVPDLATALRLRKDLPEVAFATLEGEFVSREGLVCGGAGGEEAGSVLQRQTDIRELEAAVSALRAELERVETRREKLHQRVDQLEIVLQQARERLQQRRVAISTHQGQLALVEKDLQQMGSKLESLRWEQQETTRRQDDLDGQLKEATAERDTAAARMEEIAGQSSSLQQQREQVEMRERAAVELLNETKTSLAVERNARESLVRQREPMAGRLVELQELLERRQAEISSYGERIRRAEMENGELEKKIEIARTESERLRVDAERVEVERGSWAVKIEQGEVALAQDRKEIQRLSSQRGQEEVRSAQVVMKLEQLVNRARERYQTELELFEVDSHALSIVIESQRETYERNEKRRAALSGMQEGALIEEEGEEPGGDVSGVGLEEEEVEVDGEEESFEFRNPAEPDWDLVESIVGDLRRKLDLMGHVNVDAIVEFEELEQHHRFNVEQIEDLENSREELLRMIDRINRDTRKMFGETFEQIRQNFREMFKELFGAQSQADLLLMDDGDPLESGIEIIAKPPGKKLQSISLLSGGERSMTAVALLFAIYMVKPSPFCVLDELDAPLDDANIGRFIRVLDRFIGESQFIIVTHSKRTMSRADVMYGVSMEEFGVSKTVGVKFTSSAEKKALVATEES